MYCYTIVGRYVSYVFVEDAMHDEYHCPLQGREDAE